jgi:cytochrome c
VVGRQKASVPGFNYSAAMKAKGGEWTFEELTQFLAGPTKYIPGTTMTFAGIARDGQRADVIEFLRNRADSPVPLPKVAQAPASPESKDAVPPAPAGQSQPPAPAKPQPGNSGAQPNAPRGQAPRPQ